MCISVLMAAPIYLSIWYIMALFAFTLLVTYILRAYVWSYYTSCRCIFKMCVLCITVYNHMYACVHVPSAVDRVSLSGSEYTVEEGSGEVLINITRSGELIDDIIVIFVAREIPGAINPAIGQIFHMS